MTRQWLLGFVVVAGVGCGTEGGAGGAGGTGSSATTTASTGTTTSGVTTASSSGAGTGGAPLLALGDPCADGVVCESGACVDGVCCESACDGPCHACIGSQTGKLDGACAPISAGIDPAAECDDALLCGAGTCNGAGACGVLPAATECRPSAGVCDLPEVCDGVGATCAVDALVSMGTSCRVAASACDAEEVCDGVGPDCPSNAVLGTNVTCGGFLCDGVSDLCPTACSSDPQCAQDHACVGGTCVPGRRVFITSTTHDGNLGGLAGGDAFCQLAASNANLGGTYRMWLADATGSPSTRFDLSTVPYYRFDGVMVAASYADLTDGTLLAPINVQEFGGMVASNVPFTGVNTDGTTYAASVPAQDNCSGWTSASSAQHGWTGQSDGADITWTVSSNSGSPRQCNVVHRFYCFEQ